MSPKTIAVIQELERSISLGINLGASQPNHMFIRSDHLYFDRVHPVAPMINRARYFSWAQQLKKPKAQVCLQLAMRTIAAKFSVQFQDLSELLYAKTRQTLEIFEDSEQHVNGNIPLEYIQAWTLLAHCEFMSTPHRRAMMTAGRAFRMVQIARLHAIDAVGMTLDDLSTETSISNRWIEFEEKRRTFWVAYCLDRCVSLHEDWPLTLHEDEVR